MVEQDWLTAQFEQQRPQLRAVAYRMLGSLSEADDAVQETWLRLHRSDADEIENLGGWLRTVLSRVCLNVLRSRGTRREDLMGSHVPDPVVSPEDGLDPEQEALLADSVGLALHVVLETLTPAERLAFVLHDMFAVPYDEIGPIVGRSTDAARQLASRARRQVQGAAVPDPDPVRQRVVVDAFFAAARRGDLEGLVAVLAPDVVLRVDAGLGRAGSVVVHGAETVANRAIMFSRPSAVVSPALVNGAAGVVISVGGRPISVMGFTVSEGVVVAIHVLNDPARIADLDLAVLE